MDNEHFSNKHIDAIQGDEDNNYFSPIYDEIFKNISKPKFVCDIGCGNGLYSAILNSKYDCKISGVDGSEYALKQAQKRGLTDLYKINDFCKDTLPVESNKYDFVVCKDVLEHLLNVEYLVDEIYRITKPGGYVLIHVPNHFPIRGRLKLLFKNDIDPFGFFPDSKRWNFPHIRFFTRDSLIELMNEKNLNLYGEYSYYFVIWSKILKYLPKTFINTKSDLLSSGITLLFKK